MTRRLGDGVGLLEAFRAAVDNLAEHVDEVNALNVFPVPDGDTGSNMLATVRAALSEAETVAGQPASRVAAAISFGALMGARGNSGVIASQIFRGMSESMGGKDHFDGRDLANAFNQGTATAYKAVVKPVEGTILTVIREASAAAIAAAEAGGDLEAVLRASVEGAEEAVARTPTMLAVLRDAGVVDAGGQGLYRLLEGSSKWMMERNLRRVAVIAGRAATQGQAAATGPSTIKPVAEELFGYETMFLLRARGTPLDIEFLRMRLEKLGNSVLVAGDGQAARVHVHNDRPDEILAVGLSLGELTKITVENLDSQSQDVQDRREAERKLGTIDSQPAIQEAPHALAATHAHQEGRPHVDMATYGAQPGNGLDGGAARLGSNGKAPQVPTSPEMVRQSEEKMPLAVVAVAAGDGLARIFDSYGVAAIVNGGQGNNPSTGDLLDAVEKVSADEILLLPNNPNVVMAARQASEMSSHRVRVVPTRNAAEGFAALLALDPNRDATANAEVMTLAGRSIQTLQVTEAVRDALVGGHRVKQGQTIVLDPDDGLLAVNADRVKAVLAAMKALEPGFELVTLYFGDCTDEDEARAVASRIQQASPGVEVEVIAGGQPHYRFLIAAE